jgi:MATE family multidrug resistance protein
MVINYWLLYALLLNSYAAFSTSHLNFQKPTLRPSFLQRAGDPVSAKHKLPKGSSLSASKETPLPTSQISNTSLQAVDRCFPCGDATDQKIFKIAIPAMLNYAVVPVVNSINTFWVGRMGNALALAGQGAANQIFTSYFWFFSFIPSVITPLIAKAHGANDHESIRNRVREAVFIATAMGIIGTIMLSVFPQNALSLVLKADSPTRAFALPYLTMRGITFLPALLSTIGYAVFRGSHDVITPLKISLFSNVLNVLLDPFLIFSAGMGITGAAAASCVSELLSFGYYMKELRKRRFLEFSHFFRIPSMKSLFPLLFHGVSIQMKAVAINTALLAVTRAAQRLDTTGTSAAAHTIAIQLFTLGSIPSLAMSTVASILIPHELAKARKGDTSFESVRNMASRLLIWGGLIGFGLALLQLAALPLIGYFSPLPQVQSAAAIPCMIGALLQFLNCFAWTGEGIQQGTEGFFSIAVASIAGAMGMLVSLKYAGDSLPKIWMSFVILALARIVGVVNHHFFSGPLVKGKFLKDSERSTPL